MVLYVDVILFMVEATSKGIGKGDTYILEKLKEKHKKVILIINKNMWDLSHIFLFKQTFLIKFLFYFLF